MRKVKNVAAILAVTLGVVYLVSSGSAKPLAPSLKVGFLVSDSGDLGFVGPIQRAAARVAVRDMAVAKEPVKVDISYADIGDTESENKRAIAKLRALGVDVIIAPIESESAKVLVESNEKNQIPTISAAPLEEDLGVSSSKQWFFRLATSPSQDSFALAKYISKSDPENVLVVSDSLAQSRAQLKSLSFGLIFHGIKVQTANIKDVKVIAKTKPDAVVVLSMEESIRFFGAIPEWIAQVPQLYLVPSNLGDYSGYPWAKSLSGALALAPRTKIDPAFRTNLTKALGNQPLVGSRSMTLMALAQRTHEAIRVSAEALIEAKSSHPERLRQAIAKTNVQGNQIFERAGFIDQTQYSVLRYGSSGTFSVASLFSPN